MADFKREMHKEFRELKASLEHSNNAVEGFRQECADLKKENAALKAADEEMSLELAQIKQLANENSMLITAQDPYSRKEKTLRLKEFLRAKTKTLSTFFARLGVLLGSL